MWILYVTVPGHCAAASVQAVIICLELTESLSEGPTQTQVTSGPKLRREWCSTLNIQSHHLRFFWARQWCLTSRCYCGVYVSRGACASVSLHDVLYSWRHFVAHETHLCASNLQRSRSAFSLTSDDSPEKGPEEEGAGAGGGLQEYASLKREAKATSLPSWKSVDRLDNSSKYHTQSSFPLIPPDPNTDADAVVYPICTVG